MIISKYSFNLYTSLNSLHFYSFQLFYKCRKHSKQFNNHSYLHSFSNQSSGIFPAFLSCCRISGAWNTQGPQNKYSYYKGAPRRYFCHHTNLPWLLYSGRYNSGLCSGMVRAVYRHDLYKHLPRTFKRCTRKWNN